MTKKVLYITQEITPFVSESPLSLLGRLLPEGIQEQGYEVRVFMPKWGIINERRCQLHEVIRLSGMNLIINDTDHPLIIKVASIPGTRIQVYFIDNDDYFSRRGMTAQDIRNDEASNAERTAFFSRGVLETVKKLRWMPDHIVCHGWLTSAIPFYLRTLFAEEPVYEQTTLVNILYDDDDLQVALGDNMRGTLLTEEIDEQQLTVYQDPFDIQQLSRLAIDNSDAIALTAQAEGSKLADYAQQKGKPMAVAPTPEEMPRICRQLFGEE